MRSPGGLAVVVAVLLAGCDRGEEGPKVAAPSEAPAPKSPTAETPVREMRPAELKPDEPKTADELPPLVPPAGARDEPSDAPKPK